MSQQDKRQLNNTPSGAKTGWHKEILEVFKGFLSNLLQTQTHKQNYQPWSPVNFAPIRGRPLLPPTAPPHVYHPSITAIDLPEPIGDLAAGMLLDYFLEEIGPAIYNRAIADAQARLQQRVQDLDGELYADPFQYWPKADRKRQK